MIFGTRDWYLDTAATIAALCLEAHLAPSLAIVAALFHQAREDGANADALRTTLRTLTPAPPIEPPAPPAPPTVVTPIRRAPLPPFPSQAAKTIPGYQLLPVDMTGDGLTAVSYLNGINRQLGGGDLTQAAINTYAALVGYQGGLVTGAQVNRIVREMLKPGAPYDRELPWTPPHHRDYLRADAWGVVVPGLPLVRGPIEGTSSEHPERALTYFFDLWSRDWQQRILDAHASRGYTHFVVSWPNSRDNGGLDLAAFVAMCLRIKQVIPYVHVKLTSKVYDPRDLSPAEWTARLDPVFDALNGVADEYGVWEWDSHNKEGAPTIATFQYLGQRAHAQGASFWAHFYPEHTSWFADKDPRGRFGFWDDLGASVDGLDYQAGFDLVHGVWVPWDAPMLQARIVDTLSQFGAAGNRHKLRLFERGAFLSFTGDHPTEDEENLMGLLGCCTVDNVKHTDARVWGYGNGARRPDGSVL